MSNLKSIAELAALRGAALEDLMATSDADLRQEATEDGQDLDALAAEVKSAMRDAAAGALRQRLDQAKARMRPAAAARPASNSRPPLERIKQVVQDLFQSDRSIGLAFRDGKRQTESDWQSLYDDLVKIGALKADDDGV